ncbi:cell division protein ZapA [Sphingomonas sp. 2R-10]|uniref:cell division protein ZapA n=1 Tax=Sphingomonas sp. 2R-10 TaxID=3045148 RepID=UPI000F774B07|nr:cell division protein ZapA [Sphingomonas sp. 2R-10]MDJ0277039.1 cell division protein ZapA [Sphingomonas sp. 2R-10]
MGQITLNIAGRSHQVGCRDGEEPKLRALGALLERHAAAAQRASGGSSERTLLYIALILADQLSEGTADTPADPSAAVLERIAGRLEAIASALEVRGPDA